MNTGSFSYCMTLQINYPVARQNIMYSNGGTGKQQARCTHTTTRNKRGTCHPSGSCVSVDVVVGLHMQVAVYLSAVERLVPTVGDLSNSVSLHHSCVVILPEVFFVPNKPFCAGLVKLRLSAAARHHLKFVWPLLVHVSGHDCGGLQRRQPACLHAPRLQEQQHSVPSSAQHPCLLEQIALPPR